MKSETYLTTEELSKRIKYDPRTIRNCLKDTVLVEGIHYFRPFGGRRILFVWETIQRDMRKVTRSGRQRHDLSIPMASGSIAHG